MDSVFPMLAAFDDRIDSLQEQIFAKPAEGDQLAHAVLAQTLAGGYPQGGQPGAGHALNELLSQRDTSCRA